MNTETDNTVSFGADGTVTGTTAESIDFKAMYLAQAEELQRLKDVVVASRLNPPAVKGDDRKPMTVERLRKLMGDTNWLKSTTEEKIIGLGQNPKEIDVDLLKRAFGKGNDGRAAQDLMKASPFRYRQLKEAAIVLGIYAA